MPDEPTLQVKRGGKILGPLTIVDVANLLAEGRIAESDLVCDAGGPWVTVEQYVLGHSAPEEPPPSSADALFAADFSIELDLGTVAPPAAAAPPRPSAGSARPTRARKPAAPAPPPPPVDYGPSPRVVPLSDEEIVPLEHVAEKPLEPLEDLEDEGAGESYQLSGKRPSRERAPPPRQEPKKKKGAGRPPERAKPRPSPAANDAVAAGEAPPDEDQLLSAMQALAREESRGTPAADPARARPIPLKRSGSLSLSSGDAPSTAVPSAKLPPGARPLFNGRDLAGWELLAGGEEPDEENGGWSVRDGVLRYTGTSPQPHILCVTELTDFELWIGWRALEPGSEGGIFLRSDAEGGTRCWISLSEKDAGRMLGANNSGSSPAPELQKPVGEWNVWKIVAVGPRIGLWCNRECAWSAARLDKPRGRIGLRGDGTPFEYRFLHVREVKRK